VCENDGGGQEAVGVGLKVKERKEVGGSVSKAERGKYL